MTTFSLGGTYCKSSKAVWGATFDPLQFRSKFEAHICKVITAYPQSQNGGVSPAKYKPPYLSRYRTFCVKKANLLYHTTDTPTSDPRIPTYKHTYTAVSCHANTPCSLCEVDSTVWSRPTPGSSRSAAMAGEEREPTGAIDNPRQGPREHYIETQ